MLMGLAAKNAILIIEFAKMKHEEGLGLIEAALEGAKLRLRPILMTSFAFSFSAASRWLRRATPAALSRQVMGYVVIGGMLAASFCSIFYSRALGILVEKYSGKKPHPKKAETPALAAPLAPPST